MVILLYMGENTKSKRIRENKMSITSILFIFIFLPISLVLYYAVNDKCKEYVLLMISLLFYSIGSVKYFSLFIVEVVLTVMLGRGMSVCKKKSSRLAVFVIGIFMNCSILAYYKYSDFVMITWSNFFFTNVQLNNFVLPLGISFFTFKAISYLSDIYLRKVDLTVSPVHDALYLSFFPQIQSGPLSRYSEMNCTNNMTLNKEFIIEGVYRFVIGFSKKILLANVLAKITNEVFSAPFNSLSTSYAWLGSLSFSLQLYYDFSGYSDMAIGISKMFGYNCKENFDYPYMTESVSRFWRRWHISLSEWFRDYVYIPLGGSQNNKQWKVYFNLFVVWILTGIWHGANWNFIIWGLGYFVAISFERITKLPEKLTSSIGRIIYRVLVLAFINFQWVLFNSDGVVSGFRYIKRMIVYSSNKLTETRTLFLIKDYAFFLIIALIFCFPITQWFEGKIKNKVNIFNIYEVVKIVVLSLAFIWAISFVVAGQNNPFAYENF